MNPKNDGASSSNAISPTAQSIRQQARWIKSVFVVAGLLLFIVLGSSVHAQSPNPAFPVGRIAAHPLVTVTGITPKLTWSIHLPNDEDAGVYVHFIRQLQFPSGITWDSIVASSGEMLTPLLLDAGGSQFELWTVNTASSESYLLDSTFLSYVPMVTVAIQTEDPYSVLPRTRADRPFSVEITVEGISNDSQAPDPSKAVEILRFVQSYGTDGTGAGLDRLQATLLSQSSITSNGTQTFTYSLSSIPAADSMKRRGEERFSVYSIEDDFAPASVIDSQTLQIWPVADGSISGITEGQIIGPDMPPVTLQMNDLYPDSFTWAQVYKGEPKPSVTGTALPRSSILVNSAAPENHSIQLDDFDKVFDSDGLWTMEILTQTPFGIERLASVSFKIQGLGMTIEGWRQTHFGSIENDGDGASLNDFDHDGIPNLVEFAFDLDPKQGNAGGLPKPQIEDNQRIIRFDQPDGVLGITYGVEWSPSMLPGTWLPVEDTGTAPNHCFSVPAESHPNLFLRLKVTAQ